MKVASAAVAALTITGLIIRVMKGSQVLEYWGNAGESEKTVRARAQKRDCG